MKDQEALRKIRERLGIKTGEDWWERMEEHDPRRIKGEPIPPGDVAETSRAVLYGYPELTPTDKLVYIKLQELAQRGIRKEVREEELAGVLGAGTRTLKRALAKLRKAGLVGVEKVGHVNRYEVRPGNPQDETFKEARNKIERWEKAEEREGVITRPQDKTAGRNG